MSEHISHISAARGAEALRAAVKAIYFDDSSDYGTALWAVVNALDPEMAALLESDPDAAYATVQASAEEAKQCEI